MCVLIRTDWFCLKISSCSHQPGTKFFQLKKAFAIWLNAPLEAYKTKVYRQHHPRCRCRQPHTFGYKLQTTKGFLPTYYHHYNLYSIKQPDFQLTFCKTTEHTGEVDGRSGTIYSRWYGSWSVCARLHARKGYEVYGKHGNRKHLLASMSSLNRCKNTRLNCGVEIGCEHAI